MYRAVVTLTAAQGWSFAQIEAVPSGSRCFTHSGGTVSHGAGTAEGNLEVTITFPATAPDPVKPGVVVTW